MKKSIIGLICCLLFLSACALSPQEVRRKESAKATTLLNGGFESGNLSGWSVEYGDAFDDDSVTSRRTFSFADDSRHQDIAVQQTGNWYLSGQGYDLSRRGARTGALRSSSFVLGGDGTLSMKLAGGALTQGKGTGAANKEATRLCFVGVYRASDEKMIAIQHNDYFLEHTEDYVNVKQYDNGVYHTDNFCDYSLDLSAYLGETLYLRIVDNDESYYYGYLAVDDLRVGGEAAQDEGPYYVKSTHYVSSVDAPSPYDIKNGGFETGSLAGWDILSGTAFANAGVNAEKTWWNENITYARDGNYHYGYFDPSATGAMRSSVFTLGGSGYISFKLGGCSAPDLTYLSFQLVLEDGSFLEVERVSNFKYWNFQFPYVANGMRLLNLNQYYGDFSRYLGQKMVIEAVDNNPSSDDLGAMTLDSVVTYHAEKPVWYQSDSFEFKLDDSLDFAPESEYQVRNGTFETGDLTGWTTSWSSEAEAIGSVSAASGWWNENFPYNKKGNYLFSGIADEGKTGTLTSSPFTLGGTGFISFRLGGGRNPDQCYLSLKNADSNLELARFANSLFHDLGTSLINHGSNLANMVSYVADVSAFLGQRVYLQLVDNATADWGLLTADSFVSYYSDPLALPKTAYRASDILNTALAGSENQIPNGGFETGDCTGWSYEDCAAGAIGGVSSSTLWWNEMFLFNKQGKYFFSGWAGNEAKTGKLVSSSFTIAGSGWISYGLGGGKDSSLCYLAVLDAESGATLLRYGNRLFSEPSYPYYYRGGPIDLSLDGVYEANLAFYRADLSSLLGKKVRLALVDNATMDWGLLFADDFITYYESVSTLPISAQLATPLGA